MQRENLTGLPAPLERRLIDRYGRTASGRITLAAAAKALSVLLKRHPGAALDMAAAAAVKAGRVGVHTLAERLEHLATLRPTAIKRRPLSRPELRRFVRMLYENEARSARLPTSKPL